MVVMPILGLTKFAETYKTVASILCYPNYFVLQ